MIRFALLVIAFGTVVALVAPNARGALGVGGSPSAQANSSVTIPLASSTGTGSTLAIDRGASGRFETSASVNGHPLPFVVDTGASVVALSMDDARAIGVPFDPNSFTVIAEGASGPVKGQQVTLERVEIGGHVVENVRAVVLEGLRYNLLGQTVLSQIGGVEMTGGKMILR